MYAHIDKRWRRDLFLMFCFQTPLHHAACHGGDVVEILLRNGANVNDQNVANTFLKKLMIERKKVKEKEKERGERGLTFLYCNVENSLLYSNCESIYHLIDQCIFIFSLSSSPLK